MRIIITLLYIFRSVLILKHKYDLKLKPFFLSLFSLSLSQSIVLMPRTCLHLAYELIIHNLYLPKTDDILLFTAILGNTTATV